MLSGSVTHPTASWLSSSCSERIPSDRDYCCTVGIPNVSRAMDNVKDAADKAASVVDKGVSEAVQLATHTAQDLVARGSEIWDTAKVRRCCLWFLMLYVYADVTLYEAAATAVAWAQVVSHF